MSILIKPILTEKYTALNEKGQTNNKVSLSSQVGLLGFEPRQTESKSVVLPLHHNPISLLGLQK